MRRGAVARGLSRELRLHFVGAGYRLVPRERHDKFFEEKRLLQCTCFF